MKVLIVGGTGMIGTHAATHLRAEGYDLTLSARGPLGENSPLVDLPLLYGDYTSNELSSFMLSSFDAVVFSAGNDIRHLGSETNVTKFWEKYQSVGVPRFAAAAKAAGVKKFIQLGSYYHQVMPELCKTNPYVNARRLADERARALADDDFNISTLNPPSIVGIIPESPAIRFSNFVSWGLDEMPEIPDFGPAGGTNFMSVSSLTQAISGALENAEAGKAYLIGDENLTFTQYLQYWIDVTGGRTNLAERDQEHPLQPDASIVPGRGSFLSYQMDPSELELLKFEQNDVRRSVEEIFQVISRGR